MAEPKPLILDVDGTFLRTDMLFESFWACLGHDPIATLRVTVGNFRHPALLKERLAEIAPLRVDLLPVHPEMAEIAKAASDTGAEVILASASHRTLVQDLAREHDLSPRVFASHAGHNLKGAHKADALIEAFGAGGYHYAGNEPADIPVWETAETAILVGQHDKIAKDLQSKGHPTHQVRGGWAWRDLKRAVRPHQWVKNSLLILPMIAAHDFSLDTLLLVLTGIIAFSAAASSIYIINDLLDLEADRLHPTKRNRPFATGKVPIRIGMIASTLLAVLALGIGVALGGAFLAVIVVYMVLSLAYSLKLKRMRWVDVFTLAALYTLRVVAGAAASAVDVSIYMLIFIFPVFLTLGCVKRMTELALATGDEPLPGRGYGRKDRSDLLNMSGLGIAGALAIFTLYSISDQGRSLYPTTWILWLTLIPITAWLIRMVALGYYGKQDYDPIVFALRDRIGIGLLLIILSLMFWAAGLWAQWFG
ncbi:UbiA family prenyltransferase [Oceaniglobus ichthyenteri]|uniref:UbiA family prenyltransferase n=1 Tax=Oceaniglobus ichthyenteri TaxID=2136177 RepID=UPI000D371360|nr:UbiA family prenyltransferase [Oceaniglobus ichthyenteri]